MKPARQSYPLSLVFLTVFVAALLTVGLSAIGPSLQNRKWEYSILPISAIACGLMAGLIGGMIGMHSFDRPKRAAGGALLGFLIGIILGPMLLINRAGIDQVYTAQVGGGIALLIFAMDSAIRVKDPLWDPLPTSEQENSELDSETSA